MPDLGEELDLCFMSNRERNEWIEVLMQLRNKAGDATAIRDSRESDHMETDGKKKKDFRRNSSGIKIDASQHAQNVYQRELKQNRGMFRQATGAFYTPPYVPLSY